MPHQTTTAENAWAATNVMTLMATRLADEDKYLGRDSPALGTRVGERQHELFTMVPPAEALALHFERQSPTFIAVHDIGHVVSVRFLGELATALRQPVQELSIRQQGSGQLLVQLRFVELPSSKGVPVRVYVTAAEGDAVNRRALAETLLAFSRLGVLLVQPLSTHVLAAQMGLLRDRLLANPWPNRDLLLVPAGEQPQLAEHAGRLVEGTLVGAFCARPSATTPAVWQAIQGIWSRLRAGSSAAPPPPGAPFVPAASPRPTLPTPAGTNADAPVEPPVLTLRDSIGSAAPGAAAPVPAAVARGPGGHSGSAIDADAYARICATQSGALASMVFDRVSQALVARAGEGVELQRWIGSLVSLLDTARGLSLDAEGQDATLDLVSSMDRHIVFVRPLTGDHRLAVAVVLDRSRANVPLLRTLVQRLDARLVQ